MQMMYIGVSPWIGCLMFHMVTTPRLDTGMDTGMAMATHLYTVENITCLMVVTFMVITVQDFLTVNV